MILCLYIDLIVVPVVTLLLEHVLLDGCKLLPVIVLILSRDDGGSWMLGLATYIHWGVMGSSFNWKCLLSACLSASARHSSHWRWLSKPFVTLQLPFDQNHIVLRFVFAIDLVSEIVLKKFIAVCFTSVKEFDRWLFLIIGYLSQGLKTLNHTWFIIAEIKDGINNVLRVI